MLKLNVGNLESFFRIFIGVILTYAALHAYVAGWVLYFGVFVLATGISRFSPTRAIFGLNGFDSEPHSKH
jgi:hypothetical protein